MISQEEQNLENRKFLHDLATPLTVAKQSIKRTLAELRELQPEGSKQIERLQKTFEAIEQMEKLHSDFKMIIEARPKTSG